MAFRILSKISNLHENPNKLSLTNTESKPEAPLENAIGDFGDFRPSHQTENEKFPTEEVKLLKQKLLDLEDRYKNLVYENEQTNLDLKHEKHKVVQLERQLQFVKENQLTFDKLRKAYINGKYNEATGRKLVEIRDKSVQTWEGMLCRACLDTEQLRKEMEQFQSKYNDCFIVKREEIDKINATVRSLKSCIVNKRDACSQSSTICEDTIKMDHAMNFNNEKRDLLINHRNNICRTISVDKGLTLKEKNNFTPRNKCTISKSSVLLHTNVENTF